MFFWPSLLVNQHIAENPEISISMLQFVTIDYESNALRTVWHSMLKAWHLWHKHPCPSRGHSRRPGVEPLTPWNVTIDVTPNAKWGAEAAWTFRWGLLFWLLDGIHWRNGRTSRRVSRLDQRVFINETHFHLSVDVNRRNLSHWSDQEVVPLIAHHVHNWACERYLNMLNDYVMSLVL